MTRRTPGTVVLNVDDSDERLRLRTTVLEDAGFGVLEAHTGTQALTMATDARPSLVLLDVNLPDIDGLEVCRRLKANPATEAIPVLHVSAACLDEEYWVEGLRVGADGYLREPVGPDVLREVIRTLLRRVEAESTARRAWRDAEKALRASERRYRGVVEHAPYGICHTTLDGRFLSANDALAHMLGYQSANELVASGSILPFYADPTDRSTLTAQIERGRTGPFETVWKRQDDQWIRVRISGRRIAEGYEAFIEDVTERQRLEDHLRQSHKLEAIGRVAGGVAHDFNNALTVILGFADMLTLQIGPDKPIGRDLAQIRHAAQHAAGLTQQLLAFSRQQPLNLTIIDLNGLVRDAAGMLERLLGETICVETVTRETPCTMKADRVQLQQVLVNLAVNARDAMPQGGTLTVETSAVVMDRRAARRRHHPMEPGRYVRMIVRDNGIGMDETTRRRIFEPFFTTKAVGAGTGLGLSTVYGIVKQLDGSIFVDSTLNGGTRFDLYFPQVDGLPEPAADRGAVEVPPFPATVLVVEDEAAVCAMAVASLKRHGYRVIAAAGARAALALTDEELESVDLVLTDIVMPFMSGRTLAKYLDQRRPGLRVLYMSGYPGEVAGDAAVIQGSVLRKPFTAPELLAAVKASLPY